MQLTAPQFSGIYIDKVPKGDVRMSMSLFDGDYTLDRGFMSSPATVLVPENGLVVHTKEQGRDTFYTETDENTLLEVAGVMSRFRSLCMPFLKRYLDPNTANELRQNQLETAEVKLRDYLSTLVELTQHLNWQHQRLFTQRIGPAEPKSAAKPNPFEWKLMVTQGDGPEPPQEKKGVPGPALKERQVNG